MEHAPWAQAAPRGAACCHAPRRGPQRCALRLRGGSDAVASAPEDEWREHINISALVNGPYDPLPQPNPPDESSTTLSDVSSDPLYPEEEQRRIRHEIKEFEARHGKIDVDPFVGKNYPVLQRVLDAREYRTYWRPGIVNKRLWAAAETGENAEIAFLCRYLDADVNTVDINICNYTALFWAAMNGRACSKVGASGPVTVQEICACARACGCV